MDTNFASLNKQFCRHASGAILVGDITDADSIEATAKWKSQVEEIVAQQDSPIPMVLALNKLDLLEEAIERQDPIQEWQKEEWLNHFAEVNGFIGATLVYAK